MDFYQAGYFRVGKQGASSGWKVVSPSEGMSKSAREGFGGIASNLTELKRKISANTTVASGVFRHENLVYLVHVNYAAEGEDTRGVSYTHGFCMSLQDYTELCRNPEQIFGIPERTFPFEYDASAGNYPVAKELPYDHMDPGAIMTKYGFTDDTYRQLIYSALCAVDEYTKPLCIVFDPNVADMYELYRDIMFLVMNALPLQLRAKTTFFSAGGTMAKIYFSLEPEGDNYFDLRTQSGVCDHSRLSNFKFVNLYKITPGAGTQRKQIFEQLDLYKVDVSVLEANCSHVEDSFHRLSMFLKKTGQEISGAEINGVEAAALLEKYLSFPEQKSESDYEYIQYLLSYINRDRAVLSGDGVLNKLQDRLKKMPVQVDWREYISLSIRSMKEKEDRKEVYEQINKYVDDPVLQPVFFQVCGEEDLELLSEYYLNEYMRRTLKDVKTISEFIRSNVLTIQNDKRYYDKLVELSEKLAKRRIENAESFRDRMKQAENISEIPLNIQGYENGYRKFRSHVNGYFLESVRVENFRIEEVSDYLKNSDALFRNEKLDSNMELRNNIENVLALADMVSDLADPESKRTMERVFILNKVFPDIASLNQFSKSFREYLKTKSSSLKVVDGMDYMLGLYYEPSGKQFQIPDMIRYLVKSGRAGWLDGNQLLLWAQKSQLAKKHKDQLLSITEEELRNKSEYIGNGEKQTWQYIKALNAALKGKAAGGSMERNEEVIYSAHRVALMIYAVMGMIFMANAFNKGSYIDNETLKLVIFILVPVLFLGMIILNIVYLGGLPFSFEGTGDVLRFGGTVLIALLLATLTIVFFFSAFASEGGTAMLVLGAVTLVINYVFLQIITSSAMVEE
ncbi:MAG: hypothetical protein IJ600_13050 [Lachnospiraceae bacterium]|nr:hypothetical protein [Lachnospiraceae bacterium]